MAAQKRPSTACIQVLTSISRMVRESAIIPMGSDQSGADGIEYLALSPKLEGVTGKYFDQQKEARADRQAYDIEFRKKLWELSERLTMNLE
jgi:hypothetical protein